MKGRPSGLAASTQSYQKRNLKISRNIKSFVGSLDRNIGAPKYNSISFEIFHLVGLLYCSAGLKKSAFWEENSWFTSIQALPQAQSSAQAQPSTLLFKAFNDCWGTLWAGFGEKNNIILGYYVVISGPLDLYLSKFCGLYLFIFLKGLTGIFFFFFNLWNFSFVLFTGVWQPWPTGVALVFKLSFFFVCLFVFFFFFFFFF